MNYNVRSRDQSGFTLIELLIVIAIIGILAAVLIPNLLGARTAAQVKGAQAYVANVYTTAMAYMASEALSTSSDVIESCGGGTVYSPGTGGLTVPDPGSLVTNCKVIDNGDGTVAVTALAATGAPVAAP